MVAAQASRHEAPVCGFCSGPPSGGADILGLHVCPACGRPRPLSGQEDYFSVFGLPRRFGIDAGELERRFYRVSRVLHPDRFTTAEPEARRISLERMSLLNQAYRTLRNPDDLRDYILGLEGIRADAEGKGRIPEELAESWFELQDALADDPSEAEPRLRLFEEELRALQEVQERKLARIEREIDGEKDSGRGEAPHSRYEELFRVARERSYLKSMERDVERIRARFSRSS